MSEFGWHLDGIFVGTVEGEPVNCRVRMRLLEHGTELWIKAIGVNRESSVSRSPEVRQLAEAAIHEFHCAARDGAAGSGPGLPSPEAPRLTYFPGCHDPSRALPSLQCDVPDPDRVRESRG